MIATCTYDNPATMQRECWRDGELLYSYSFLTIKPYAKTLCPALRFFYGANIGPWESGRLVGDIKAMDKAE